ncbi:SRPBCC domain-containing protein [Dictyobacter aurantiacus]|uniref:Carbon monoxide dehydrogenase subunit G n=1 Tax=Dictyobacter aurantiacus TaxID=1936993 RepID=A0A401ZB55_9CHLR|nr:SRPBCC domain-containing protein [Dictyobacter aurantiacus]GCE04141.1 hypothetical protein KDAU_14700 [Dictyobacter aurantiacus]
MNIEGTYTLQASPQEVWRCLTDREILSITIPGLQQIKQISPSIYDITLTMSNRLLAGSHHGVMTLSEQQYPYHYRLTFTSDGETNLSGAGSIHLHEREHKTIVAYKGTLTTNKSAGKLTPALIKGAIKHFIQQYFQHLAEYLRSHAHTASADHVEDHQYAGMNHGDVIVIPRKTSPLEAPLPDTLAARIVRLLRLGARNPRAQLQWEQRIRRTGTITGLAILVWVGTRLPRRRG